MFLKKIKMFQKAKKFIQRGKQGYCYEDLWDFLSIQKADYILSFDGKTGDKDMTYEVPTYIYNKHEYIYNGISGFNKLNKRQKYVSESLYIKRNL